MKMSLMAALLCLNVALGAASAFGAKLPPLETPLNDLAGILPDASSRDLNDRLVRFKQRTGKTVVVLTVPALEGEPVDRFARRAFAALPLERAALDTAILLLVSRKDRQVTAYAGPALRHLFPEPETDEKLHAHVALYSDGLRPDLGIYSATHYIFGVITGEFNVARTTREERLENQSVSGRGAGAIFAVCLAPYLALVVGMLWGVYSTHYRVQCATRLFVGVVLGGGSAKLVALVLSRLGGYGYDLWYFILALSVILAGFGSLTEFWMSGDWCAIPRVKDPVKRKPEDNMGI